MNEIDSSTPAIGYLLQTRGVRHQDGPPHKRPEVRAQMDVLTVAAEHLKLAYTAIKLDFSRGPLERFGQLSELQKLIESHNANDPPIVIADVFDVIARFPTEKEYLLVMAQLHGCVIDGNSEQPLKMMGRDILLDRVKSAFERRVFLRRRVKRSALTRKQRGTTSIGSDGARLVALREKTRAALRHATPVYELYQQLCDEAGRDYVPFHRVAERANELGLTTSRGNPYDAAKARDAVLRCKKLEQKQGEREKS